MAQDPSELIAQLMAAQGGGGGGTPGMPPGNPGMPMPPTSPPTDEAMLDEVSNQMGGPQPPPGSNMKWENLEEDQKALQENPSPENVQAFIEYWGREELPEGIPGGESPDSDDASDEPGGDASEAD